MKVEIFLIMAVFRPNWGVFVDLQGRGILVIKVYLSVGCSEYQDFLPNSLSP